MSVRARRATRLLPLLVASSLWGGGCVSALDLDREEYQDAIFELCKCIDLEFFGDECNDTLRGRLANVTPEARGAWLTNYTDRCAGSCSAALECYDQTGTCSTLSCRTDAECCGFNQGVRCNPSSQLCE